MGRTSCTNPYHPKYNLNWGLCQFRNSVDSVICVICGMPYRVYRNVSMQYRRYSLYTGGSNYQKEDVEIDKTLGRVMFLLKVTRDYVNFIVLGNDATDRLRTNKFDAALERCGK